MQKTNSYSLQLDQIRQRIESLRAGLNLPDIQQTYLLDEALTDLQVALEELIVAEEELRQQNDELAEVRQVVEAERQRYQDLFEFAPDAYLVTDFFGKIEEANRSAAFLINISQQNLIGKPLTQYIAPEDRKVFRMRLNELQKEFQSGPQAASPADPPLPVEWELSLQPRHGAPVEVAITVAYARHSHDRLLRWLIRDISERKRIEKAIQSSETRFRTLADTSSAAIFLVQEGQVRYANAAATQVTGYPLEELLHMSFRELIYPRDRERILAVLDLRDRPEVTKLIPLRREGRLLVQSGEECRVDLSFGLATIDDEPVWIVTAYDITERFRAEETRRELAKRLVEVQEDERRRISLELHDQMGQNLAALTMGLKSLEENARLDEESRQLVRRLKGIGNQLGREIHQVAFELRPASLDDLGLKYTLGNYLEEWSQRYGIAVDFEASPLQKLPTPPLVATNLFRIVQEALTNILKHAHASHVSLIVDQSPTLLRVIIEDNGVGFLPGAEPAGSIDGGLGIPGMQERAKLVGGTLTIESELGGGTTIFVTVPLQPVTDETIWNGSGY